MGRGSRAWVLAVVLSVIFLLTSSSHGSSQQRSLQGTISSWIDGDTVRVRLNGRTPRVRLIGIDTPEISQGVRADRQGRQLGKPRRAVIELGYTAKAAAEQLAPHGTVVMLELDVERYDRYSRLLAYIWLPNGLMVNEELLARGYAMLLTYPPNVKYVERFIAAQRKAVAGGRGLWSSSPAQPSSGSGQTAGAGSCDPAYPTVCIPPPPPDLDCKDVSFRNFQVLPPDPHRFDGNGDGIGCER